MNSKEGGDLFIGVSDDGDVLGLENIDKIQLQLSDRIKNNIKPVTLGLFDIVVKTDKDKKYIHLIVSSGQEKPYYIAKSGMSPKRCYIRVGSGNQQMPEEMIEDLFSRRTRNSLSKIKSPRKNLSFEQLQIYYQAKGLSLNDKFCENLELLSDDDKYNYNGYLLADDNGVSIKVAKYAGKDKVDPIALREAVVNAFVHNDYTSEVPPVVEIFSDRVQITSYGGLVSGLSPEDFFECRSMPRNRELMRVFKDLDMVEQLGSGMERILKFYDESSFKITPNFLVVTFMFDEPVNDSVNDIVNDIVNDSVTSNEQLVLNLIKNDSNITIKEISRKSGVSESTVNRSISKLKKLEIISRSGADKTGNWIVK